MNPFPWLSAGVLAGSLACGPAWALAASQAPALAAAAAPALAAPPTAPATSGPISLRTALTAAWQRAVAAREADGQHRRAQAEQAVAASSWAAPPSLALSHRDDRLQRNTGRRETEIAVAVPLWLPGQRQARTRAAEGEADLARAAEQLARLRLAGDLREAAWQLAALQAEAAQATAQALALQQLADDVARRVRAGDLARADALAAQAEQLAAQAVQAELQQRLRAARAHWAQLTGQPNMPDLAAPDLALPASGETATAPHPELQLARSTADLARQRLALLRQSQRDAPELSLGLRHDVPGRAEAGQTSLAIGLRLPLGTAGRNQPLQAAAWAELDVAQTQEQRLRERLEQDLATAHDAQATAERQLQAETARSQLLRERARLLDTSFRAGETPLPDLLRALAAAAQADGSAARQAAALGLARARLQQAYGLLP